MSVQEEHILTLIKALPQDSKLRVIEAAVELMVSQKDAKVEDWQVNKAREVLAGIQSGKIKTISKDDFWNELASKTGFDPRKAS